MSVKLNRTDNLLSREARIAENQNWQTIEDNFNNVVQTVSDKAYGEVVDAAKLNWKEPVASFANLPTTANTGDTVMVRDTGKVYRYNGTEFKEIQEIDAGPVNEVDSRLTSQLADITEQNNSEQINVMYPPIPMIGAKGDNVTDDTEAIQNIANSFQNRVTLFFPKTIGYLTTDTIDFPSNVAVVMKSPIIFSTNDNKIAIIIRSNSNDQEVMVRRKTVSDWTNENSVGVQFNTISTARLTVSQATGFTIGAQFIGDGGGFAYNQITLGDLQNNKIHVDLTNRLNGWCNENLFTNGRFWTGSAITSERANELIHGVRITSQDGLYTTNNNNNFMKPSFEIGGNAIPILIEHGQRNEFSSIRTEKNSGTIAIVKNNSMENVINIGYIGGGSGELAEDSSETQTTIVSNRTRGLFENSRVLFKIDNLHKKSSLYNGYTSRVQVPGLFVIVYTEQSVRSNWSEIGIHPNYLEVSSTRGIGRFVDTSHVKRFIIRKDVEQGYGGRVYIQCYDGEGNLLPNTISLVKGRSGVPFTPHSYFGGTFRTGSDFEGDIYFSVHNDVKRIAVIIAGGTNPCRIKGLSIDTLGTRTSSTWSGYEEVIEGVRIGTTYPRELQWVRGQRVYNAEPSPGNYQGWVCVESGTPGTWKGFGSIES